MNRSIRPRDLYERQAGPAGDARESHVPNERNAIIVAWLARTLNTSAEAVSAVELGCGDGNLALTLCRAFSRSQVLGLDIVPGHIATANAHVERAGLHERARFELLDDERHLASLPSERFDLLIAIDVLEHVFDVFEFVRHAARVVKPNGLVLLRVPNIAYIKHRLTLLRGGLPVTSSWFGKPGDLTGWRERWGWDGGHLHCFTRSLLEMLLRDAGIEPLQCRDPGSRAEVVRRLAPSLFMGNLCVLGRRR